MFQEINSQYPDYTFRYLIESDYHNGLFDTLGQLTKAPLPSFQDFRAHLARMESSPQQHVNIVGIEKQTGRVLAFGTLLVCGGSWGKVGKIENIVTCKSVRGKRLGKCIIQILKWLGWDRHCNKITLFCQQKNIQFYSKLGFKREGIIYAWYSS